MVKRTMGTVEWALVGLLALLWGGTFYFVEIMLEAMDPVSAVLLRVAPAAALTILVHGSGLRLPGDFATWRALFIMGLLNNVLPFTLITWGQTHIESGLAAILNATTPLFTVVLAHWLTRDADFLDRRGASHGLDVRGFISHHLGAGRRRRGARTIAAEHRPRLSDLFPRAGHGVCDQPAAGYLPDAADRPGPRRRRPG